jgi:hypothetical protein
MNDTINIQGSEKTHTMKKVEYARWLCLVEAIDLIERKASELKADLISDDFWVKPLAFQKYIEQRLETMVIDVDREEFNIPTNVSIDLNKDLVPVATQEEEIKEEDVEPSEEDIAEVTV